MLKAPGNRYQQPANRIEIREVVVKPQPNICRIHTESLNLAA